MERIYYIGGQRSGKATIIELLSRSELAAHRKAILNRELFNSCMTQLSSGVDPQKIANELEERITV